MRDGDDMPINTEVQLKRILGPKYLGGMPIGGLGSLVDSIFSIGGVMTCQDVTMDLTTSFKAWDVFTESTDTKGITENLSLGHYTIKAGADGSYPWLFYTNIISPGAGTIDIIQVKDTGGGPSATGRRDKKDVVAGVNMPFFIMGGGNLDEGNTIGIAAKGSSNATVQVVDAGFLIFRI